MDSVHGTAARPGEPLSAADAALLRRFDARMRLPLIVSAVLPLIVAPGGGGWVAAAVGVVTWLVFVADFAVHARHVEQFIRTGFGRFNLVVVVLTAPWFLLPHGGAGGFVVILRLAWLARLVMASRGGRRLVERLGCVAAVATGVVVVASLTAYYAEHPKNPGFATVGDALWWGIVTLTTVGYGDIVPKTSAGRWAGVSIMITGIAVLGLLAGSLASFFRLDSAQPGTTTAQPGRQEESAQPDVTVPAEDRLVALITEVAALREQVQLLAALITNTRHRPQEIPPPEGEPPS